MLKLTIFIIHSSQKGGGVEGSQPKRIGILENPRRKGWGYLFLVLDWGKRKCCTRWSKSVPYEATKRFQSA
jgi:hypothetical protein